MHNKPKVDYMNFPRIYNHPFRNDNFPRDKAILSV